MPTTMIDKPMTRLSAAEIRDWIETVERYLADSTITGMARIFIEDGLRLALEVKARREANGDWDR